MSVQFTPKIPLTNAKHQKTFSLVRSPLNVAKEKERKYDKKKIAVKDMKVIIKVYNFTSLLVTSILDSGG